jgi:hypothetical protein
MLLTNYLNAIFQLFSILSIVAELLSAKHLIKYFINYSFKTKFFLAFYIIY